MGFPDQLFKKDLNGSLGQKPTIRYFACFDVEATCQEETDPQFIQEIIEFPVVLIDAQTLEIIDEFHHYVQPRMNPQLTPFCTKLTGITQEQVNAADSFVVVLKSFEQWLSKYVSNFKHIRFVTDGKRLSNHSR